MALCPACESALVEIRSKHVCPFCHIIVETCCDGGECRPAVAGWKKLVEETAPARQAYMSKVQNTQEECTRG
jgi:hypothetical protein